MAQYSTGLPRGRAISMRRNYVCSKDLCTALPACRPYPHASSSNPTPPHSEKTERIIARKSSVIPSYTPVSAQHP